MATANEDGGEVQSVDAGVDENEFIKEWTILTTGVMAVVGVAFAVFVLLVDVVDQTVLSVDGGDDYGGLESVLMLPEHVVVVPFIAIAVAALIGLAVAWEVDVEDDAVFKAVAVSAIVGTAVAWIVAGVLGMNLVDTLDIAFGDASDSVSFEIAGLVINSILAGIAAAIAGVGSAWLARNQTPSTSLDASESAGGVAATDD